MAEIKENSLLDTYESILKILLKNLILNSVTDEIPEDVLIEWIQMQNYRSQKKFFEKKDVLDVFSLLSINNAITRKIKSNSVVIAPTKKYFELKEHKKSLNYDIFHYFVVKLELEDHGEIPDEDIFEDLIKYSEKFDKLIDEFKDTIYCYPYFKKISDTVAENSLVRWLNLDYYSINKGNVLF